MGWENFLAHEKLSKSRVSDPRLEILIKELDEKHEAKMYRSYQDRLKARRIICDTAMDLGIDIAGWKFHGKIAMGRGLLDIWNTVYRERFGTTYGTAGWKEDLRRGVKTRLRRV